MRMCMCEWLGAGLHAQYPGHCEASLLVVVKVLFAGRQDECRLLLSQLAESSVKRLQRCLESNKRAVGVGLVCLIVWLVWLS